MMNKACCEDLGKQHKMAPQYNGYCSACDLYIEGYDPKLCSEIDHHLDSDSICKRCGHCPFNGLMRAREICKKIR